MHPAPACDDSDDTTSFTHHPPVCAGAVHLHLQLLHPHYPGTRPEITCDGAHIRSPDGRVAV